MSASTSRHELLPAAFVYPNLQDLNKLAKITLDQSCFCAAMSCAPDIINKAATAYKAGEDKHRGLGPCG